MDRRVYGRDHNPQAFTIWMAGAGVKRGHSVGQTDEFGYSVVQDPVQPQDLHATMLHLLGLDHAKLTFPVPGGLKQRPARRLRPLRAHPQRHPRCGPVSQVRGGSSCGELS